MPATAEVIDKIRKLLRLSRSANPHEAQLALQRALALARSHGVEVESLNPDASEKAQAITHTDTPARERLSYDKEYASRICAGFFRVTPVFRTRIGRRADGWPRIEKVISFVGTAADVEIALYVYGFLVHHFAFCWRTKRGRLRNRRAYVDGMFYGLYSKLLDAEPAPAADACGTGAELVLAAHTAYIAAAIGKFTSATFAKPDLAAKAASWAGFMQGRRTSILDPLKAGAAAPLALR